MIRELRYAVKKIPDHADGGVLAVHDVERDQPRHHCGGDQTVDVEINERENEPEKGIHHRNSPP